MTFKRAPTPKMSRFGEKDPTGTKPIRKSIVVEEMKKGDLVKATGVPKEESDIIFEDDNDIEEDEF